MEPQMFESGGTHFEFGARVGECLRANEAHWFKTAPGRSPRMVGMFAERKAGHPRATLPWAGEYAGKYLVGAIDALRLSADPNLKNVIAGLVRDLIASQGDDGYLGPFGPGDRMTQRRALWDLWGHYHCMLGLLRWHQDQQDLSALAACRRAADLFCRTFIGTGARVADAGSPAPNQAIAHLFALLYRATGEARYLQMVREVEADWASGDGGNYVHGFQHGEAFYQGHQPRWESLHAVQALPELFAVTGDERYRRAFTQIWWSILAADRHITGGFSSLERAVGNPYDPRPIETCATVGWMCLTVDALRLTGDARAADELEMSTWNAVLGSQSADGSWWTYDTPMGGIATTGMPHLNLPDPLAGPPRRAGERCPTLYDLRWQEPGGADRFSCCALNGPRGLALLAQWAVMRSADGVVLNYYGPGEMRATTPLQRSVRLAQETDYPIGGSIRLGVSPDTPERFTLRLRIPGWSSTAQATVNGQPVGPVQPGSYLVLDRQWSPGDIVTLDLNMSPRFAMGGRKPPFAVSDGQAVGRMSVWHGPLLMAYDARFDRFDAGALPAIDRAAAPSRVAVAAGIWEPLLLLRFPTLDGRALTLCDFASAGTMPWIPTRRWQLARSDGTVLTGPLTLLSGGTIQGSTHPNESRWGFEGTDLTFYGGDGRPTTRFSTVSDQAGRIRLEGIFLPDPTITHVLRQVDADVSDTLWDFVRIDRRPEPDAVSASPIRLDPFGRVHGYRHPRFPNEVRWQIEGADVVLCNHEGRPTARLAPGSRVGEARTFTGAFIPDPQFTHRLQELDVGWVRGSAYVSWLPAPVAGPVTALSTRPGGTSLFAIGADGQVWSRFFPDPASGGWSAWFPLGPNVFPAGAEVTALSTAPGGTSLYVLGFDRQVWSRFFPDADHPGQWSPWFPLGPNVFPAGSRIVALSTVPNGTSLYVLGLDGQIWSRFFPDGEHPGQWSPWFPLGPNVFPPESSPTAVSTMSGGTSLYAIGFDEQVWSRFFPDAARPGEWSPWFPLGPNVFCASAPVTAVSTAPGHTNLFVVGFDQQVWSRFFPDPAQSGGWSPWFPLGPNVFPAGSPVTAVSTRPGGISLFVVGFDEQVWSRFFPDPVHASEWSPWFPLGPNAFPTGSPVAALSTAVGATSLYVNGFDGQIWSRFFPGPRPGEWSDWFPLGVPARA
jgi:DUF1680 family protein